LTETGSDNQLNEYTVKILIEDANNTFFLPLAGYGSSDGFKIALKSNFNNIGGTLMNFNVSSSLNINKNDALDRWDVPTWEITPSLSGLILWGLNFDLSLSQIFATEKKYIFSSDDIQQQYTYHRTTLKLKTSVKLPYHLSYSFGPSLSFNYGIKEIVNLNPSDKIEQEFSNLSWSHSFGYSKVDWIDNLRNGLSANLSNRLTVSYDLDRTPSFSTSVSSNMAFFYRINHFLNLSGRAKGSWSNREINITNNLRGVKSGYMKGYLGAAMSLDMTISLINLDGLFEIQARPFFDIGIVANRDLDFNKENDLAYTTGLDGILYIDRWRSFVLRGTFGIDLSHFNWNDFNKYEIEMTAGLSY